MPTATRTSVYDGGEGSEGTGDVGASPMGEASPGSSSGQPTPAGVPIATRTSVKATLFCECLEKKANQAKKAAQQAKKDVQIARLSITSGKVDDITEGDEH
ncbi:hypothetical protein SARC_06312 [Sphaeroforma arctica JP610]|uniref:Uncharacterized protein n=1 Tax=Sphaeroforma arctica JP610 TaxID=667725 RepID=A0A0L0FZH3_9EUKA|nr:hypothetical protein SARC_06312 [Sphaeroforma arctica JP610]KNC81368.1 hypothetical protein SARC_06312 [Sphaeroforma arctica JP610]|eukprot:XP_014155270.1 hypothetical protein SARC_06312 [Sphaeroforma arctica JP610]